MVLLRFAAAAVVIALACSSRPAAAQAVSPNAAWSCVFADSPADCGFYLQAAAASRATLLIDARDGNNAVELTTQPGDSNLYGSGTAARADLEFGPSTSYCNQGQEEWWAHSLMFPDDYVVPPPGATSNWGVVFNFHHTGPSGQANFQIVSLPTGLEFWIAGGPSVVNGPTDPGFYSAPIGTVLKNQWYDFVYHVKWSSGNDGFFQAWVNGQQLLNFNGPTLYVGESCYLKLANYHTPLGVAESVIHDRIVRGTTRADVEIPDSSLLVPMPNVVGETQGAASTAITGAGLLVGTLTQQPSSTVASGYVIGESPAAATDVASGSAVHLVVSTGDSGGSSSSSGGSGSGGGGGIDALTLGALLSLLIVAIATRSCAAIQMSTSVKTPKYMPRPSADGQKAVR